MSEYVNIIDGFRLAIGEDGPPESYSPLYEISCLLLGRETRVLSSSGKRIATFIAEMEQYSSSSFIPVVEFPVGSGMVDLFGSIISSVESTIIRQASIARNVATGIKYMIEECADNILEHSCSEFGYISTRYDRTKNTLDICIADKGITLLGSYRANNDADITSDLEAIQAANRGFSTKNRPDAENRGYGLMTTKKMAISGLDGAFAMISGGSIFICDPRGRRFIDASDQMRIPGTIIAIRLSCSKPDFNYINYIE